MRFSLIIALLSLSLPAAAQPIDGEVARAELSTILQWAGINTGSATPATKAKLAQVIEAGLPDAKRLARALERAVTPQRYADGTPAHPSLDGRYVRGAIKTLAKADAALRSGNSDARLGLDNAITGVKGVVLGGYARNSAYAKEEAKLSVSVVKSKKGRPFMLLRANGARRAVAVPLSAPRGRIK